MDIKHTQETIKQFFSPFLEKTYEKGSIIISAEEHHPPIYFLQEGLVHQYSLSQNGDEMTITLYKPGTFFPIIPLLTSNPNTYFFSALKTCTIKKISREEILAFLTAHPDVLMDLTKRLASGLHGMLGRLETLLTGRAEDKLMHTLLLLAKRFGTEKQGIFTLPLSLKESEIAAHAGIRRETVSRLLQTLKKKEIIREEEGFLCISTENHLSHPTS